MNSDPVTGPKQVHHGVGLPPRRRRLKFLPTDYSRLGPFLGSPLDSTEPSKKTPESYPHQNRNTTHTGLRVWACIGRTSLPPPDYRYAEQVGWDRRRAIWAIFTWGLSRARRAALLQVGLQRALVFTNPNNPKPQTLNPNHPNNPKP